MSGLIEAQTPQDDILPEHSGPMNWEVRNIVLQENQTTSARVPKRKRQPKGTYNCPDCDRAFDTRAELTKHERIHLPEDKRPHGCDVCGKRFLYAKDLRRHSATHARTDMPLSNTSRHTRIVPRETKWEVTFESPPPIDSPRYIISSPLPATHAANSWQDGSGKSSMQSDYPYGGIGSLRKPDDLNEVPSSHSGSHHDSLPPPAYPTPTTPSRSRHIAQSRPRLYHIVKRVMERNIVSSIQIGYETLANDVLQQLRIISRWTNDATNRLCDECEKLELTYESFVITPMSRSGISQGIKAMGTLRQLFYKSSHCPLCRLIVKSLAEQRHTSVAEIFATLESRDLTAVDTTGTDYDVVCEVAWQIDGRERVEDDEGNIKTVPRTRRLCIKWPKSNYAEAYLVLIHPGFEFGPRSLFLGRFLTSLEKRLVDQIREWYQLCLDGHGQNCAIDHQDDDFEDLRNGSYFGVVDVTDMHLTALPKGESYVALSYTWGQMQEYDGRFRTTLANIDAVKEPGSLREVEAQLPQTIRDAISLVRELGFRYLWVDSLCILQGDEELWSFNASRMNAVYGHAALTICAADGSGVHCGLLALQPMESRYDHHAKQIVAKIKPGMELMVSYPSETYIQRSVWNTRAWTFQERVLSKRCVIFTEGRVYFQCRSTTMSEDIHTEEPQAGRSIELLYGPLQRFKNLKSHPVDVYKYSVYLYTSRFLTREEDILAAFSGISKEICHVLGGETIYGLPNTHFDFFLLWQPEYVPQRRLSNRRLKFPSWAWCGWKHTRMTYSPVIVEECESNLHEWLMKHTWITWYIRDGQGNLRLVWDHRLHNNGKGSMEHQWNGYCGDSHDSAPSVPVERAFSSVEDQYRRRIPEVFRGLPRDVFQRTMPKYPYQVRMVEPGYRSTNHSLTKRLEDQRFLQFWTWSAHFQLVRQEYEDPFSKHPTASRSNLVRFGIHDKTFDLVGSITLDAAWMESANLQPTHEFIAISDAKGFTEAEMNQWNFVEPSLPGQTEWYAYNVIMLEYDDEIRGVARRAGLGKIYKRGFETACLVEGQVKTKRWKEIILG